MRLRLLAFLFAALAFLAAPAFADTNGIQMLPPLFGGPPQAGVSQPCPVGANRVLTWDGTNPIGCSPTTTLDANGNVTISPLTATTTAAMPSPVTITSPAPIGGTAPPALSTNGTVQVGGAQPAPTSNACPSTQAGTIAWMQLPGDSSSQIYICNGSIWTAIAVAPGTVAGFCSGGAAGLITSGPEAGTYAGGCSLPILPRPALSTIRLGTAVAAVRPDGPFFPYPATLK